MQSDILKRAWAALCQLLSALFWLTVAAKFSGWICSSSGQPAPFSLELPPIAAGIQGVLGYLARYQVWYLLFTVCLALIVAYKPQK